MQSRENTLKVEFKRTANGLVATCKLFPNCKGLGKTEPEALKSLSRSITRFVSRMFQKNMDDILLSDRYTDVISDPFEKRKNKIRLFSPNTEETKDQKTPRVVIKLEEMKDVPKKPLPQEPVLQPYTVDTIDEIFMSEDALMDEVLNAIDPNHGSATDSMFFGFPMSFN